MTLPRRSTPPLSMDIAIMSRPIVESTVSTKPGGLPRIPSHNGSAQHLLHVLAEPLAHPLRVIRAPRGYGKTALIVTWLRTRSRVPDTAFLTLDPSANVRVSFWRQLADGLTPLEPDSDLTNPSIEVGS